MCIGPDMPFYCASNITQPQVNRNTSKTRRGGSEELSSSVCQSIPQIEGWEKKPKTVVSPEAEDTGMLEGCRGHGQIDFTNYSNGVFESVL